MIRVPSDRSLTWAVAGSIGLAVLLTWLQLSLLSIPLGSIPSSSGGLLDGGSTSQAANPFLELAKLITAALIGVVISAVQRATRPEEQISRSMEQAQVLLCVSGALMMIIIGNSLARAFGIAGAASIIRFRTPVDDPRDVTILFLLMGLGMAAGLGALGVAGLGTLFLTICLVVLSKLAPQKPKTMKVELVAAGPSFPSAYVEQVFASHRITLEPLEVSQGEQVTIRYRATFQDEASLEALNGELLNGGTTGLKSVSWEARKKSA